MPNASVESAAARSLGPSLMVWMPCRVSEPRTTQVGTAASLTCADHSIGADDDGRHESIALSAVREASITRWRRSTSSLRDALGVRFAPFEQPRTPIARRIGRVPVSSQNDAGQGADSGFPEPIFYVRPERVRVVNARFGH